MAKKIPVDRLAAEIEKILTEYGEEVQENVDEATQRVAKAGAKAVRANANSTFDGTGKYAKGWKSKFETAEQNYKNQQRSTGSQSTAGVGTTTKKDPIDLDWYSGD